MKVYQILSAALLMAVNGGVGGESFHPESPANRIDFESLEAGASIETLGWTGTGAPFVTGAMPKGTGKELNDSAIQADPSGSRRVIMSPVQTITPPFSGKETVYFSAWFKRTSSQSSGGRVQIRDASGEPLGGFGVLDTKSGEAEGRFALFAKGEWHLSAEAAKPGIWYELALVIKMNPADMASSSGSLFIRDVTAGETSFRPLQDLAAKPMGYGSGPNAADFAIWRIESFRNNAQLDNLAAGVGTLSPSAR